MMYDPTAVELTGFGFTAVWFSEEDKSRGGGVAVQSRIICTIGTVEKVRATRQPKKETITLHDDS